MRLLSALYVVLSVFSWRSTSGAAFTKMTQLPSTLTHIHVRKLWTMHSDRSPEKGPLEIVRTCCKDLSWRWRAGKEDFRARPWTYLTIPIVAALVGYITNWLGVKMLFYPIEWRGIPLKRWPMQPLGLLGWQVRIPRAFSLKESNPNPNPNPSLHHYSLHHYYIGNCTMQTLSDDGEDG